MNTHSVAATHASELDRLGDEIAELSAHLEAAGARLLTLIREFDARGGWEGFSSCAAWLSWRIGLDPGAARERVRVARALGALPRLARLLQEKAAEVPDSWLMRLSELDQVMGPEQERKDPELLDCEPVRKAARAEMARRAGKPA